MNSLPAFIYDCVACACLRPVEARRYHQMPCDKLDLIDGSEAICIFSGLNLGSLEVQQWLLAPEPSVWHRKVILTGISKIYFATSMVENMQMKFINFIKIYTDVNMLV